MSGMPDRMAEVQIRLVNRRFRPGDTRFAAVIQELKAAGVYYVIQEAQKQINEILQLISKYRTK